MFTNFVLSHIFLSRRLCLHLHLPTLFSLYHHRPWHHHGESLLTLPPLYLHTTTALTPIDKLLPKPNNVMGYRFHHKRIALIQICLFRLYQFEPEKMSSQIVARILVKTPMAMPAPNFSLCLFLIPERVV